MAGIISPAPSWEVMVDTIFKGRFWEAMAAITPAVHSSALTDHMLSPTG
jgi:hypothetical protein